MVSLEPSSLAQKERRRAREDPPLPPPNVQPHPVGGAYRRLTVTEPTIARRYQHSQLVDAKPLFRDSVLAERGTQAAANDDVALAIPEHVTNPLWVVTAGLAVLFAFLAVAVATG